jgi:hypothetical protein
MDKSRDALSQKRTTFRFAAASRPFDAVYVGQAATRLRDRILASNDLEQDIRDTFAYAKLRGLGIVSDDGLLKRTPSYINAYQPREKYQVCYRITGIDAYSVHMQFIPVSGPPPKASRECAPTMAVFWNTWTISVGTEADFLHGSDTNGT